MKINNLKKVPKRKSGKIIFTNPNLELHERETIFCLSSFGFDIETVIPSHTPGSDNPDIQMLGTFWEIKGPKNPNKNTITKRFRKAVRQSGGRAIFDLRNADSKDEEEIEKYILKLFKQVRGMRRIIIIKSGDSSLDVSK